MRFFLTVVAAFLGVLAAFFFTFLLIVGLLAAQDPTPSVANRTVLVLDLNRPIPETRPTDPFAEIFGARVATLRDVTGALEKAAVDDRIVGVWLQATGVQASWATLAEIRDALETYRASGKPLVASSGTHGFTEASYYLASVADSIYAPPESTFLMNGMHISAPFFGGSFERLGIDPVVVRAGDFKSAAENLTERGFSPENRQQYREILEMVDGRFRDAIAQSRTVSRAAIDQAIAEGGIHAAGPAHTMGLLDELRYEEDVAALWRAHTRQELYDDLRTISLREYARVPERDAGLSLGDRNNRIAVIYATGVIMPGEGGSDGSGMETLGSERFVDTIREALGDDRTRAIVIRVDSPGGSATASDAMWAAVRDAAREKPVVVSMASVAASGGYYIAAPAHVIVAEPATITGSIGVISVLFDATQFLDDRLGITIDTMQTGPAAGLYALGESVSPLEVQILERETERIYETFVQRVAEGRDLSPDSVRALGGGRVYTGSHAQHVGLVDELGDLQHAVRIAAQQAELGEDQYRLLVLPRPRPLIERLSDAFSAQALAQAWVNRNMIPEERILRQEAAFLKQAVEMNGVAQMRMWGMPEIR